MLFVTNNANSSSYTHHIKEQFCLPKEKDMTSHLQLDFNDRLIYTGNKVKSSKGKKREKASIDFYSFGTISHPGKNADRFLFQTPFRFVQNIGTGKQG